MKKILFITLFCVLSLPLFSQADTKINNSISVSTNGGNNTVQVKTTYNGEVIEEVNLNSSSTINYSSNHTLENNSEKSSTTTLNNKQKPDTEEIARLQALLEKLQLILKLYEQLLAEKI